MKQPTKSRKLFARASAILPGGVDSPVRAFKSVGATPLFITKAAGSSIDDATVTGISIT
jgi:glutamate-1-semialdehyde 2,1-aminomutase